MSYKNRWTEPSDREAREEYRKLRRELKHPRTQARRLEIEVRLDEIAKEPSENREPAPSKVGLPTPVSSGEAAREAESILPSETEEARRRALERAQAATAQVKAAALLEQLPEHPLNRLARELAQFLWAEDKSWPKQSVESRRQQWVRHWLSDGPYNRHDLRGRKDTVEGARADALRLVAERDARDAHWFVQHTENSLAAAVSAPPEAQAAELAALPRKPVEANPVPINAEPEPLDPIARAGADIAKRPALILATDSWLTNLAAHSPEMRNRVVAALSDELLRVGAVSAEFCVRTYNAMRPRAVSQLPERTF